MPVLQLSKRASEAPFGRLAEGRLLLHGGPHTVLAWLYCIALHRNMWPCTALHSHSS